MFVALGIRHACASALLSSVTCPARQYISTLSHKRHDFRKKQVTEHKIVFRFSPQRLSETILILRITNRDIIKNVCWSSCKVPVIFVRF